MCCTRSGLRNLHTAAPRTEKIHQYTSVYNTSVYISIRASFNTRPFPVSISSIQQRHFIIVSQALHVGNRQHDEQHYKEGDDIFMNPWFDSMTMD